MLLHTLLAIELLALGPPGLRSTPQAGWIGIHMASIRFHCHNNLFLEKRIITRSQCLLQIIRKIYKI